MDTQNPVEPPVVLTRDGRIGFLTLNRPKQYNALSAATLEAMHAALDEVAADTNLRVLVIAAQGKAFCAGHDLKEMKSGNDPEKVQALFARCGEMMLKIARLPMPVIAEVQGMATAAGCQMVAQCDLAVAAASARFAVSGINLGLFCSTPAVPLSRAIARKRAAEMLMTGDFIDAATALEWGLVNRVSTDAELRATTMALASKLVGKPRDAMAMGKALFYRQMEAGLEAAYKDASGTIACNFFDPAAQEGIQAFIDKRPPNW